MPDSPQTELTATPSTRKIIHVDMDAFYASVEQHDEPSLAGQAVIVGGRPNGRGVVAACSYEARRFGIHSAMPAAEAARRCPQAVFVRPRFERYRQVSQQVHEVFREFTEQVEPLSLDEAYLDVTGSRLLDGSALRIAREIKAMIRQRTGLTASAGVSYNKFLAKIASDWNKPDGLFCVLPADGEAFIAALPVGKFHGIGRATEARMHELGIRTGADLRTWSRSELIEVFGKSGEWYHRICRGIDERPVRASRTRKSLGSERTFAQNLTTEESMQTLLVELATRLYGDLTDKQLIAGTLNVKVRFADFRTYSRSHSLRGGFSGLDSVLRTLPFLLQRALDDGLRPGQRIGSSRQASVRLLGVSFSRLSPLDDTPPPSQYELPL